MQVDNPYLWNKTTCLEEINIPFTQSGVKKYLHWLVPFSGPSAAGPAIVHPKNARPYFWGNSSVEMTLHFL
jgi:hypothetical protein